MSSYVRSLLRDVHLWLGLSLGGLFALLGLTGSALVFYQEIDVRLHPEIQMEAGEPAPDWGSPVWDRALATVRRQWPQGQGQWRLEATGDSGPIPARYYPSGPPDGHMSSRMMVWLSPDGSKVLRQARWGAYPMSWIYELHMDLLAGEGGHRFVGWSGLVVLFLLGTGFAAWWPRGAWRKALAFKRKAAPVRRLRDLHKLAGLWSLILLVILTGTGVMLALPKESNWLLARTVGPIDTVPNPESNVIDRPQISIARAIEAAHAAFPDARLAWVEVPALGHGVFKLRVQQAGDPSVRFPHSYAYVDQYDGRVLAVLDASRAGPSTTINNWLHALHDASVGGLATRILAVVVGLAPAMLFVTGLLHWRAHLSARRKSARIQSNFKINQGVNL